MRDILLVTVECLRWDHRLAIQTPPNVSMTKGIAPGHYTRPSLAGLHSGTYQAAARAGVGGPTLAEKLRLAGFETVAATHSPQTSTAFDFHRGFDAHTCAQPSGSPVARGSFLRERLGSFGPLRRLHRWLKPKRATLAAVQPDHDTVADALDRYDGVDGPAFLWVHLMDSHRPYGRGDNALPVDVSHRAANASPEQPLPADERDVVTQHYRDALDRASNHVRALIDGVADDAAIVVAGDHGEEVGEHGIYFHGGYRRRVVDELVEVPVYHRNVDIDPPQVSLAMLPWLLAKSAGVEPADKWLEPAPHCLTVAPWNDAATLRYSTPDRSLVIRDGELPTVDASGDVDAAVEEQLEALGYAGIG